ncbi:MAG: SoxR reducing system RseC family protein [Tissierellia bacterium]|nr:SoxR reducing system RseC family protein [Tissierellia bacterium]
MKQVGRVIRKKEGMVDLEVIRQASCGADCSSCKGSCEHKSEKVTLVDTLGLHRGDFVELNTSFKGILAFLFLVYGLPTLFFFIGVFISLKVLPIPNGNIKQLASFGGGILGIFLSILIIRFVDKRFGKMTTITMERKL